MSDEERQAHIEHIMEIVMDLETPDTIASMLVVFGEGDQSFFGLTRDARAGLIPEMLRKMADDIEENQTGSS